MSKRRVPHDQRIAALTALQTMKPRTSLATVAQLVDGAAILIEQGASAETVRAILHGLRLSPAQEDEVLRLLTGAPSRFPQAAAVDLRVELEPEADG